MKGVKSCKKKTKGKSVLNPLTKEETTAQVHSLKFKKPSVIVPNEFPREKIRLTDALIDVCNWSNMKSIHDDVMQRTIQIENLKKEEMRRRHLENRAANVNTILLEDNMNNDLLFLSLETTSMKIPALYDSGSEFSLIDIQLFDNLKKAESYSLKVVTDVTLITPGKDELTIVGSCNIPIQIMTDWNAYITLDINFLVIDKLPNFSAVIGLDTITRYSIYEQLHNQAIYIDGKCIPLHKYAYDRNSCIAKPSTTESTEIQNNNVITLNLNTDSGKENLMVLNIGLKDYWTFCLYDTGCQYTLISKSFLEKSNADITDFSKTNISLVSINGKSENNVCGKCNIYMQTISDQDEIVTFPVACLIVKDLSNFPAILGINSIIENKIECKMYKKILRLAGHEISLLSYPGASYYPFFSDKNHILSPKSGQRITFHSTVDIKKDNVDYDESDFLRNQHIYINFILQNNTLEIENKSRRNIYICPQRILGFISRIRKEESDSFSLYLKLTEEYNGLKYHTDNDFRNPMEALLPDIQKDIEKWTLKDVKLHGTDEDKKKIMDLCHQYEYLFARSKLDVGLTKLMTHKIQIDRSIPIKPCKQIHHHGPALEYARKCIAMWLQMGIIEKAEKPIIMSNLLLIPKIEAGSKDFIDRSKAGKLTNKESASSFRPVVDLRQTNSLSRNVELPNAILPDSIISKLRNKITSNFDLVNAFFNIELEKQSRRYCAFFFEKEKFQFARLTQGLNSSPAALAKLLSLMFDDEVFNTAYRTLSEKEQSIIATKYTKYSQFIMWYFDDIWLSTSGDIEEHLVCLKLLFEALKYGGVLLSPKKCTLFSPEVNVLGLTVQTMTGNILLDYKRGMSFVTMARPNSLYELSSRLSSMNYFRQFLPKLKEITTIFYTMLKENKFRWTELEEAAWVRLKAVILLDIKLTIPAPSEQLLVTCDASNMASSQCLWVLRNGRLHLVSTNSKLFGPGQFRKPIHYKETMSLMFAIKTFYPYLLMTEKRVIFFTDARNLLVLNRSREHSILAGSLTEFIQRTCMIFQFVIYSIPSQINWMSDLCSRSMTTSRYIDEKKSRYTISKDYLEYLPTIDFNLNISENILLKLFNNEIEPIEGDTGKLNKTRPKSLIDCFQLYLDSTPEEAFLSAILFLREISRDLCNVKLHSIGIELGELETTLKDEYVQRQLLKKNEFPEQKSTLKALINSIITKTIDKNLGKTFQPGERTRIKNCLFENFIKMVEEHTNSEDQDSEDSLTRIQDFLKDSEEISCHKISTKSKIEKALIMETNYKGSLVTFKEEDAGYDFIMGTDVTLKPRERKLIESGVKLNIPKFHCGVLFLRSSVFKDLQIWHGIIDSGYSGEIKYFLENISNKEITLHEGERYVQIIIFPVFKAKLKEGTVKSKSIRQTDGFGSTNIYATQMEEETEWLIRRRQLIGQIRQGINDNLLDLETINILYRDADIAATENQDDIQTFDEDIENEDKYARLHAASAAATNVNQNHQEKQDTETAAHAQDNQDNIHTSEEETENEPIYEELEFANQTIAHDYDPLQEPTYSTPLYQPPDQGLAQNYTGLNVDATNKRATYSKDFVYEDFFADDTLNNFQKNNLQINTGSRTELKFTDRRGQSSGVEKRLDFSQNMQSTPKESSKSNQNKQVSFCDDKLVQEIEFRRNAQKQSPVKILKHIANTVHSKIMGTTDSTSNISTDGMEQGDSQLLPMNKDSFTTYRDRKPSTSESDASDTELYFLKLGAERNKTSVTDHMDIPVDINGNKIVQENNLHLEKVSQNNNATTGNSKETNEIAKEQGAITEQILRSNTNQNEVKMENIDDTRMTTRYTTTTGPSETKIDKSMNFIRCYTTYIDQKASDHAIQSANLSITFLEKDIIDKDHFIQLQRFCEVFNKHYSAAKKGTEKYYQIKNDLLYYTKSGFKLCIPYLIIVNTIKYIHESFGHASVDQTQKIFNRYYYYPSSIKIIQDYVGHCMTCALCTWNFDTNRDSDTRSVRAKYPLEIISLDIIPNLPRTEDNYTSILIMMDEFSTHLFIYPMKDRSHSEVLKQLKNFLSTIGFPKYFRSDQETSLISALKNLASKYAIIPIYSNAYKHHQNNVEAGVCYFKKVMNKIIYDVENPQPKSSWHDCAIKTVNIINNSIPSGCKSTKRELFYNAQNKPPFLAEFTMEEDNINLDNDLKHRAKDYEKELKHDKKHHFKINDLVVIRNHAPTATGLSSSFNLKMSTDIYIITAIKDGSKTITIKCINTDKEKNVNSEDLIIIPIEDYFFQSKGDALDKLINKDTFEKNSSSENTENNTNNISQKIEENQETPTKTLSEITQYESTDNSQEATIIPDDNRTSKDTRKKDMEGNMTAHTETENPISDVSTTDLHNRKTTRATDMEQDTTKHDEPISSRLRSKHKIL